MRRLIRRFLDVAQALRVLLLCLFLLLLRGRRLRAEPDAAGLLLLASFRVLWRLRLGLWRRVLRLRGWLGLLWLLGLGLRRLGFGCIVVLLGLVSGRCLGLLGLWCALLLLRLRLRRR